MSGGVCVGGVSGGGELAEEKGRGRAGEEGELYMSVVGGRGGRKRAVSLPGGGSAQFLRQTLAHPRNWPKARPPPSSPRAQNTMHTLSSTVQ